MAASKEVKEWEGFAEEVAKLGIEWSFSPVACPWRNGQAERAVGLAKSCLKKQVDSFQLLTYPELETALIRVAAVVNQRPLNARLYADQDDFFPVAPADLLHGRMAGYAGTQWDGQQVGDLGVRLERVNKLVQLWWQHWQEVAFELFVPRQKWKRQVRELQVGDVVLLKGEKRIGPGEYRLARVSQLHPDSEGVVRTVTVAVKARRRRKSLHTEKIRMAVQRLCVLLPLEEQ